MPSTGAVQGGTSARVRDNSPRCSIRSTSLTYSAARIMPCRCAARSRGGASSGSASKSRSHLVTPFVQHVQQRGGNRIGSHSRADRYQHARGAPAARAGGPAPRRSACRAAVPPAARRRRVRAQNGAHCRASGRLPAHACAASVCREPDARKQYASSSLRFVSVMRERSMSAATRHSCSSRRSPGTGPGSDCRARPIGCNALACQQPVDLAPPPLQPRVCHFMVECADRVRDFLLERVERNQRVGRVAIPNTARRSVAATRAACPARVDRRRHHGRCRHACGASAGGDAVGSASASLAMIVRASLSTGSSSSNSRAGRKPSSVNLRAPGNTCRSSEPTAEL